jgi:hypothetical protein
MKTSFNISGMSFDELTPQIVIAGYIIYFLLYWRCLVQILGATRFEAADKILWFLVITLAPVIGIITYWFMVPENVRNMTVLERHRQRNQI